jgi:membrane associated rhomboid family serine protease
MKSWLKPGTAFNDKEELPPLGVEVVLIPFLIILAMWIFYWADFTYQLSLYRWGIFPRQWQGLVGIVTAPVIHGDLNHLTSNTIPILLLGVALYYFYPQRASAVISLGWLASGVGVWFFARESYHVGASGLVYALVGFIFFSGIIRGKANLLALSLLVVFIYGSLFWGLLPVEEKVSHEAHIAGGSVGLILAVYFRGIQPRQKAATTTDYWQNDDLSREIAKFGHNYWQEHTQQEEPEKVVYHFKSKEKE